MKDDRRREIDALRDKSEVLRGLLWEIRDDAERIRDGELDDLHALPDAAWDDNTGLTTEMAVQALDAALESIDTARGALGTALAALKRAAR